MANRFKNLRNTAAGWTADDKIVGQGEIALVVAALPTGAVTSMKLGDGVSLFSQLPAFSTGPGSVDLTGYVTTTALNAAGYATSAAVATAINAIPALPNGGTVGQVVVRTSGGFGFADGVPGGIADNTVTTPKLADASVTAAKLADGGVTTVKHADASITAAKLADGSVSTVKLADGGVTIAKLASAPTKTILGRTATGLGPIQNVDMTTLKADLNLTKADVGLGNVSNVANPAIQVNGALKTPATLDFVGFETTEDGTKLIITAAGGVPQIDPVWVEPTTKTDAQAARFLHQIQYGSNPSTLSTVKTNGMTAYLDAQLNLPITQTQRQLLDNGSLNDSRLGTLSNGARNAYWTQTHFNADKVRSRVSFALSEIWVLSSTGSGNFLDEYKITYHMDALRKAALGNFRTLMTEVTRSFGMSIYLTYYQNNGQSSNSQPDENYAREILQLFSIGKFELNIDGSFKTRGSLSTSDPRYLAGSTEAAQTYTNDQVQDFAKVFTGLGPNIVYSGSHYGAPKIGTAENATALAQYGGDGTGKFANDPYWDTYPGVRQRRATNKGWNAFMDGSTDVGSRPLGVWGDFHNLGEKRLFGGTVLPAYSGPTGNLASFAAMDAYAEADIELALDNIFNHPNVGPFIGEALIKLLVTSNPSRNYVARVAKKFNNNGSGIRGDMKAVVRQIFLDVEARDDTFALTPENNFGRMREPFTWWLNVFTMTRFKDTDNLVVGHQQDEQTDFIQNILTAPSVFNWFRIQDFRTSDLALLNPPLNNAEFQMVHETTIIGMAENGTVEQDLGNSDNLWIRELCGTTETNTGGPVKNYYGTVLTTPQRQAELALLVDRLSLHLAGDQVLPATKTAIITAVDSLHAEAYQYSGRITWHLQAIGTLIKASPDYRIMK